MPTLTTRTITDPEGFLAELEDVRSRGYAIDDGENEEGGRCVAVPLALARPGRDQPQRTGRPLPARARARSPRR